MIPIGFLSRVAGLATGLCCFTMLVVAGCSGAGSGTGDGVVASTADCSTTTSDALVSIDQDENTSLAASAVTSDCAEVAIYEEDGNVSQVAFVLESGEQVVTEFNSDGEAVAIRSGDDTLTISYNDGFGFARSEFTSGSGESTASVFSVNRDDSSTTSRSSAQNGGDNAAFCDELKQFASVLDAACTADPEQPFCDKAMDRAAEAAAKICTDNTQTLGGLEGTTLGNQEQDFALGVDGFITARPAANDGTTFICAAEAFGGQPPYDIQWALVSTPADSTAPLTQLPGGAAVADATVNTGTYEFDVTVTDAAGGQAVDSIVFELGDEGFFGAKIVLSTDSPEVGAEVSFKAIIQGFDSDDATAAVVDLAPGTIYWDLGDGTTATGESFTHSYSKAGVYDIYLVVIAGAECDFSDFATVVVGGGGDDADQTDFKVDIVASADSLVPGGLITLTPTVTGAIKPVDFGWGIINEDGQLIAAIYEVHPAISAQSVFTETAELEAFDEGIVQVGLLAVDAAGRVAIATQSIPVFGTDGGLFAVIEGPFELEVGVTGVLQSFAVGGDGALSYDWFIEDDPFSLVDDTATISDSRAANPEITAREPGFLGIGLTVTDATGTQAFAFNGIFVFAEGFDDLFVEFLGPFEVPVAEPAPLHSFIVGGEEPYFCSWHIFTPTVSAVLSDPFNCFETIIEFAEPGCVEIELEVEDMSGALGFAAFSVCGGSDFAFECPFDGLCDPNCQGFDPDCDDPCPFDGFCDEFCSIGDPDCFEEFEYCLSGDGFCDDFCTDFGPADPDCNHCTKDDVCVFGCSNGEDVDCSREFCVSGDAQCDFGCVPEDADCAELHCQSGDGFCDFPCDAPDPDCGTNADLCNDFAYCCEGDGFCDSRECPSLDTDCNNCLDDGLCVSECDSPDPDCNEFSDCLSDVDCADAAPCSVGFCDFGVCVFETEVGCSEPVSCSLDSECDDFDPCTADLCDFDHFCVHEVDASCTGDAVCGDGVCDAQLGEDQSTCATDCQGTGYCGDLVCDAALGEEGTTCPTDCLAGGVCGDGICDPGIGEDTATCANDCLISAFCGDGNCDTAAAEDCTSCDLDCGSCP